MKVIVCVFVYLCVWMNERINNKELRMNERKVECICKYNEMCFDVCFLEKTNTGIV